MFIGVPIEAHRHEHRVGLTPYAVQRLGEHGHTVVVETNAGLAARFTDREYEQAGAQIVYQSEEAYKRADVICRVGFLGHEDLDLVRPGSTICAFHHLAVAPKPKIERLMELEATVIGYELIQDQHGDHPVLDPMSEMAGQMAVHVAAHCLQNESGGRGILLGAVPGIPAATVVILGAGTAGHAAARQAVATGAHVIVFDQHLGKLRALSQTFAGQVETMVVGRERLKNLTAVADVVIGAVLIPGARAPYLVTEEMVQTMKGGSVIVDMSIDQGGCVETSRPTTPVDPTYLVHDVVHYCVPNMTANIARTASRTLADAVVPHLLDIGSKGLPTALQDDPGLAEGIYLYEGKMVNRQLAETLDMHAEPLGYLTARGHRS